MTSPPQAQRTPEGWREAPEALEAKVKHRCEGTRALHQPTADPEQIALALVPQCPPWKRSCWQCLPCVLCQERGPGKPQLPVLGEAWKPARCGCAVPAFSGRPRACWHWGTSEGTRRLCHRQEPHRWLPVLWDQGTGATGSGVSASIPPPDACSSLLPRKPQQSLSLY